MAEVNTRFLSLVTNCFQKDITKPEDDLTVLVHWLLLQNNFQVLHFGNENVMDRDERPSDILPENWSRGESYKLRYTRENKLFILNGVKAGDGVIYNLYDVANNQVSSAAVGNIDKTVSCLKDFKNNREDFSNIVSLLKNDLIDPMYKANDDTRAVSTQTHPQHKESESALLVSRSSSFGFDRRDPFPTYGLPDIDPLGGLRGPGEGMIFDPTGNGRAGIFPRIYPSTRFDPEQPPDADPFGNTTSNPDHT
ncbi:proteasome inhibitor PI31 subunit-like [Adelges cooleyi]|uniref:proteasome inhibitor PI31 subunit-like n=1 Tax=Adelges cooleyi TaxID=133065 RepID=UPI00217FCD8F|nr:proteasome inhibitor PI31 subunit-like [Adelges cooleyi]